MKCGIRGKKLSNYMHVKNYVAKDDAPQDQRARTQSVSVNEYDKLMNIRA